MLPNLPTNTGNSGNDGSNGVDNYKPIIDVVSSHTTSNAGNNADSNNSITNTANSNNSNGNTNSNSNNTSMHIPERVSARDLAESEQKNKEDYRKNKQRDAKELEEYRQNARFAQTDYSSFDSAIHDKPIETYYCCYCGNYCLVVECALSDCATRVNDNSYAIDIKTQIFQPNGIYNSGDKYIKHGQPQSHQSNDNADQHGNDGNGNRNRSANKILIERQFIMSCKSCHLPVAYRHRKNLDECQRIFILNDALSNDPTCLEKKIQSMRYVFNK